MKKKQKNSSLILGIVITLGIIFRFYKLDSLPMEMYGDIVDGYQFTQEILRGLFPFYFVLGNGPLFFYLFSPLFLILGLNYLTIKIASNLAGLSIILIVFHLSKQLSNSTVALLAAFLLAISKWALIFSRLGSMTVLVPLFTSLGTLLFLKIIEKPQKIHTWLALGFLLGIGMYNYPAYHIFPIAICFLFLLQGCKFISNHFRKIILTAIIFLIFSFPFLNMFFGNLSNWTDSQTYYGHKIFIQGNKLAPNWPNRLFNNIKSTALMFNWKGDPCFRVNPPNDPQLDFLSGTFFLLGLLTFLTNREIKFRFQILFIFLFLFIPEVLVLNVPSSIPSGTMTIGTFPFVYLITAQGIYQLYKKISFLPQKIAILFLLSILGTICLINAKKYFVDYAYHLPNHNESFSRLIAQEVDKLPPEIAVYMYGGSWGDWGQPDWRAVYYEMRKPRKYIHLEKNEFDCSKLKGIQNPIYFILNPYSLQDLNLIKNCFPNGKEETHYSPKFHFPVFISYSLE